MTATLSIVIPTHNRAIILQRCLDALFHQVQLPAQTEIIVVDDGSVDGTPSVVEGAALRAPGPLTYLRQQAAGPAAARNRGIHAARGDIVLFLGDDIIATSDLVAQHLSWHERFPDPLVGVLGFVTWSPELDATPYMRWLESSGNQFAFEHIAALETVDPALYLYTSNVSLKRVVFEQTGEWFDEQFRHALLEDIDLGRRLAAKGVSLRYNPAAAAVHEHAVTLEHYARRIELSSEYWVLLEKKRPGAGAARVGEPGAIPVRRNYLAYAWFLIRVSGEVIGHWPFWWLARYCETRRLAPTVFRRAHRYWAQRGLLRLEARKAMAKVTGRS